MLWRGFQKPKRLAVDTETLTEKFGKFSAQPFERGFGTTVGNALRRVLLSSIEGAAVTAVKIEGVLHEFQSITGVVEDATSGTGLLPPAGVVTITGSTIANNSSGTRSVLYGKTLDNKLNSLTKETRLTSAVGHSIDPTLSFGPKGEAGVLFGDERTGSRQVYFTHLECVAGTPPR